MARIMINGKYHNFTGIKEAVGDAQRSNQYYRIYCDYSDGTVWTNEYNSSNSWSQYNTRDILEIASGTGKNSIFGLKKITMEELKERIIQGFDEWEYLKSL